MFDTASLAAAILTFCEMWVENLNIFGIFKSCTLKVTKSRKSVKNLSILLNYSGLTIMNYFLCTNQSSNLWKFHASKGADWLKGHRGIYNAEAMVLCKLRCRECEAGSLPAYLDHWPCNNMFLNWIFHDNMKIMHLSALVSGKWLSCDSFLVWWPYNLEHFKSFPCKKLSTQHNFHKNTQRWNVTCTKSDKVSRSNAEV